MALSFLPSRRLAVDPGTVPRAGKPNASGFRFPGPSDRVTVIGMTGSGKSTFALWLFAESADFDRKPWVLVDFKGEDIIERLPVPHLSLGKAIPKEAGVYRLHPDPRATGEVEAWLWRAWEQGDVGLVFDEAYMIPEYKGQANAGGAFKAILTQGRSKNLGCYVLAQRPVDLNRHVFSENTFLSVFRMKSGKDFEKILDSVPDDENVWNADIKIGEHWSRWYDAKRNLSYIVKPCPGPNEVVSIILDRLGEQKQRRKI